MNDLEILITEPNETLEVEYKDWLDLHQNPHKALLAKELIALANHGGGHVVLGIRDVTYERIARPNGYDYVDTDYVNGIVARYADPAFHCVVTNVLDHVVISVSAGTTVPIRSTRGAANNEIISDRYYIRRPGPNSEPPQSGLEWDELLRRCLANRDAELENMVRRVIRALGSISENLPPDPGGAIESLLE